MIGWLPIYKLIHEIIQKMNFRSTDVIPFIALIASMGFHMIKGYYNFFRDKIPVGAKNMNVHLFAASRAIRSLLANPYFSIHRFRLVSRPIDFLSEVYIKCTMDIVAEVQLGRLDSRSTYYQMTRSGKRVKYTPQNFPTGIPCEYWEVPDATKYLGKDIYWDQQEYIFHSSPSEMEFTTQLLVPKGKTINEVQKWIFYCPGGAFLLHNVHLLPKIQSKFPDHGICNVRYGILPEKQYPQSLVDCLDSYWFMVKFLGIASSDIWFLSDSAGGNVMLSLLISSIENRIPLPKCVVLISPWSNLRCTGLSWDFNKDIDYLDKDLQVEKLLSFYCGINLDLDGAQHLSDPIFSPVFGILNRFPPVLIQSGSLETLLSDHEHLHKKLVEQDAPAIHQVYNNVVHLFQCYPLQEANEALNKIVEFVNSN
eukprot:NODE_39_length_35218_cov_0.479655.p4 type:complete len:423 gc:universal NODE_39_length_35218_cov_0.479655:19246-17978(-)